MPHLTAATVLKLLAWSLLLLVTALTVWREPVLTFLDDFFDMSVAARFGMSPPEATMIQLPRLTSRRAQTQIPDDLIADVSEADRAALLYKPLAGKKPTETGSVTPPRTEFIPAEMGNRYAFPFGTKITYPVGFKSL